MPKYRLLSKEELESLEKEFVEYLIVNGIMADDWVKLKEEEPTKAEEIVDLFSDVIFESIMRSLKFLERRAPKHLEVFQCLPEKIVLLGLKASPSSSTDFTDEAFVASAATSPPDDLELYKAERPYKEGREQDLFRLTQEGCEASDGKLFKTLALMYAQAKAD